MEEGRGRELMYGEWINRTGNIWVKMNQVNVLIFTMKTYLICRIKLFECVEHVEFSTVTGSTVL
jgi:hypothetical protein